jgi:hypothetical protein
MPMTMQFTSCGLVLVALAFFSSMARGDQATSSRRDVSAAQAAEHGWWTDSMQTRDQRLLKIRQSGDHDADLMQLFEIVLARAAGEAKPGRGALP